MDTRIEAARADDVEEVLQLLSEQHLPVDGVREHAGSMLVARQNGRIVGCAALEMYPEGALLRSVPCRRRCKGPAWVASSPTGPSISRANAAWELCTS